MKLIPLLLLASLMAGPSPAHVDCSTMLSSTHPLPSLVIVDGFKVLVERDPDAFSAMAVFVKSSDGHPVAHWESFSSNIHVLIHGNTLYRTNYHPLLEGLTLAAHDLTTGKLLWETKEHGYWDRDGGVGSSDHKNWGARICLEGSDLVLIGREGDGGYVERIDPKSGAVLERTYVSREARRAIDAKAGIDGLPTGNDR